MTGRLYPSLGSRNTNNLGIGAFTDAYLDEFMIFNRVLTAAEVATLFSGTPIYLASNNATNSIVDYAFSNRSLQFPGTTHTGTVALNPITFSYGNAITMSAWVKFASLDAVPRTIISLTNATDSIRLAASASNYLVYRGDVSFNVPIVPATNTWTHVVANNANIGTNTWTVTVNKSANTSNMNILSNTSNNVYTKSAIGMDASSSTLKMDGFIDDVRMYNSTLSRAQISQLYDGKVDANALVSHYTFDSLYGNNTVGYTFANFASSNVVYDVSITNTGLYTSAVKRLGTGCLSFPSTSFTGTVTLGSVDLRADVSNATISTWVNFSSLDFVPRTIFSFGQNNRFLTLGATFQNYSFTYRTPALTRFITVPGPNLNSWNHIAIKITNDIMIAK